MTPDEIRRVARDDGNAHAVHSMEQHILGVLGEIAAQLAELNINIKRLSPTDEEVVSHAVDIEIAEDEEMTKAAQMFQEILSKPTSNPETMTRCIDCGVEMPRPSWCPKGTFSTCDSCFPF